MHLYRFIESIKARRLHDIFRRRFGKSARSSTCTRHQASTIAYISMTRYNEALPRVDLIAGFEQGFRRMENLEEYASVKVIWLEGNGFNKIEGLTELLRLKTSCT